MKYARLLPGLAGLFLLAGCLPPQHNPEFSNCANACTTKLDACMVNASTATETERCNSRLDACTQACEKKYSRYL